MGNNISDSKCLQCMNNFEHSENVQLTEFIRTLTVHLELLALTLPDINIVTAQKKLSEISCHFIKDAKDQLTASTRAKSQLPFPLSHKIKQLCNEVQVLLSNYPLLIKSFKNLEDLYLKVTSSDSGKNKELWSDSRYTTALRTLMECVE